MMKRADPTMGSETGKQGDAFPRIPYPNPGWARLASLVLAIALSALFFIRSQAIADLYYEIHPTLPALLMWGTAIGFIHGVGFVPRWPLWRLLFSPFVGWPLMGAGIVLALVQF